MNTPHNKPQPTPKRAGSSNAAHQLLLPRLHLPSLVRPLCALLLVLLVTLATGCATSSTLPKNLPVNPQKPQPSQSQPSEPYLSRAQKNIEAWLNQLKDMRTTP